jgi:hypothetical protein
MGRRSLVNLALAALVAALALVVVLEPGLEAPPPAPTLGAGAPGDVARVTLERPGEARVVLVREDGRWRLVEPLALPANDFKAEALAELVEAPVEGRVEVAEGEAERFGLAQPAAVLTLGDLELRFGATAPVSGHRYVARGGEVLLIPDRAWQHLTAAPAAFASTALLGRAPDIVRIELPARTLRRGEAGWEAEPLPPEGLGADALVSLAQAWENARALTVRAHGELPEDTRRVAVTLAGEEAPREFRVYGAGRDRVFARPAAGVDYLVPEYTAERMLALPDPPAEEPSGDGADAAREIAPEAGPATAQEGSGPPQGGAEQAPEGGAGPGAGAGAPPG